MCSHVSLSFIDPNNATTNNENELLPVIKLIVVLCVIFIGCRSWYSYNWMTIVLQQSKSALSWISTNLSIWHSEEIKWMRCTTKRFRFLSFQSTLLLCYDSELYSKCYHFLTTFDKIQLWEMNLCKWKLLATDICSSILNRSTETLFMSAPTTV